MLNTPKFVILAQHAPSHLSLGGFA